jgi:hypothetical protein
MVSLSVCCVHGSGSGSTLLGENYLCLLNVLLFTRPILIDLCDWTIRPVPGERYKGFTPSTPAAPASASGIKGPQSAPAKQPQQDESDGDDIAGEDHENNQRTAFVCLL